ncbi:MAG TPA: sensor histidine kinase [Solirubrobacterales bacterium]|nr:sensor histidine kinase [Solirubrobacterales bacterium]
MRRRALFTQVLVVNAVLLGAVAIVAGLIAGLSAGEVVALAALAVIAGATVNMILLRRRFAPLEDLIGEMEKVDLSRPGSLLPTSIDGVGETEEVERIELAFLRMMRRLEAERRRAGSAALQAQEEERARVARDLHDEVNQSLTGLLLRLEAARSAAPPALEPELAETKALANQAMRELLDLARRLRPTALDDLGLAAAIAGLVERLGEGEIRATIEVDGSFSDLGDDAQLVVYRVTQEALSNAARHSGAANVTVALRHGPAGVELSVADDGRGFAFAESERGLGIGGMRERALLVGGELTIESRPGAGTTVHLTIPESPGP